VLKSYDEAVAATEDSGADATPDADEIATESTGDAETNETAGASEAVEAGGDAGPDSDPAASDETSPPEGGDAPDDAPPVDDVDPVTRDDVAESALRFDDAIELGTREAVIEELRSRIEGLPELSRGMLRHYRREGASDPVAAHIDAGGDGDSGHAYSRHRPIRRAGLIRHAGRGHYAYAVPDLVREAYADRLGDAQVDEIVRAVETVFVPPAELSYPPDADPSDVSEPTAEAAGPSGSRDGDRPTADDDEAIADGDAVLDEDAVGSSDDGGEEPEAATDAGLSDAARRFAERSDR
jgi:hypothetical protein